MEKEERTRLVELYKLIMVVYELSNDREIKGHLLEFGEYLEDTLNNDER